MRTCVNCGKKMAEGYLLEEMGDTFCSDFCLDIAYPGSSKEMANMTDEQLEESTWYWTSWEEDDKEDDDELMPLWLAELINLHNTTTTFECGCNPSDMSLCIAGNYLNGGTTLTEIESDSPGEPGECPRCFEPLADGGVATRNSICRIDNKTILCNDCGTEQAFKEWVV